MKEIGILIFPQVEELDFVGPLEVFGLVNRCREGTSKQSGLEIFLIAPQRGEITCVHGLRVFPGYSLEDAPSLDLLIVPGGPGARTQMQNPAVLDFIRNQAARCELVASVCTGALILAAAGLLKGKRATTHWSAHQALAKFDDITVVQERFVRDGNVVTSAGISAGIDMTLFLVKESFGEELAEDVSKRLEWPI